jgi:hypothetical protein
MSSTDFAVFVVIAVGVWSCWWKLYDLVKIQEQVRSALWTLERK